MDGPWNIMCIGSCRYELHPCSGNTLLYYEKLTISIDDCKLWLWNRLHANLRSCDHNAHRDLVPQIICWRGPQQLRSEHLLLRWNGSYVSNHLWHWEWVAVHNLSPRQLHLWCDCFAANEEVWAEMEGEGH